MTLVYRAVWEDDWCEPLSVLEDEFKEWCSSKGIDADEVPHRGRYDASSALWLEVRRADAEIGRVLRCTLSETDSRGRTWTTTATALADINSRSFWVDLTCVDPRGGQPEMAAPRLVRSLISNGGRPATFGVPVRTDARRLVPTNIAELSKTLLDEDRRVPIVVFSPDLRADPTVTVGRADAAAETLAGIAHVYAVTPLACDELNHVLGKGFGVYGGAVRLYLPDLNIDDPDDTHRHRWIPLRLIAAHPRRAASLLAGRLARLHVHQPIPDAWDRLGGLLRRPTEAEVGTRAAEIATARGAIAEEGSTALLKAEIDELTKLLAEADLMRETAEVLARNQVAGLEENLVLADAERYDDADELEDLRRERDGLQKTIRAMARPVRSATSVDDDPHHLPIPKSIGEAVEAANEYLGFVRIPRDALRDTDELDATAKYLVWGSSVWQGLMALNEYAALKSQGESPPGFKLWCDQTGAWPTSKLAMTESDSVISSDLLRSQRHFPVDVAVCDVGRIHMFSHLKIQAGGGDNIPRLYFHDDTNGRTAKIHIGFIGPHRHVRNTKS